ncbi:hypothetical protein PAECIP111893_02499 [Paenibacillus plantiphilus]|uniref:Copper amine oxidase-like N-terminal domain-containing protein n=2 Tax=Paenibacillus plantiphilus TaxID=2905650 RepID=A0ABM9C9L2_9BACL|nr:hypothetical protein PAECIP111893_02499 [Paenibacillus plantiphilus]
MKKTVKKSILITLIFSFFLLIDSNPTMAISESPKVTINERVVNVTEDWKIPAKDAYKAEHGFTDPAGKKIFFHYYNNSRETVLACIDIATGRLLWETNLGYDIASKADHDHVSPDDMIYYKIRSEDGSGVMSVNSLTGKVTRKIIVPNSKNIDTRYFLLSNNQLIGVTLSKGKSNIYYYDKTGKLQKHKEIIGTVNDAGPGYLLVVSAKGSTVTFKYVDEKFKLIRQFVRKESSWGGEMLPDGSFLIRTSLFDGKRYFKSYIYNPAGKLILETSGTIFATGHIFVSNGDYYTEARGEHYAGIKKNKNNKMEQILTYPLIENSRSFVRMMKNHNYAIVTYSFHESRRYRIASLSTESWLFDIDLKGNKYSIAVVSDNEFLILTEDAIRKYSVNDALHGFSIRANPDMKVFYNGTQLILGRPPMSINDVILLPMREVFEAHGAQVLWDSELNTITATKDSITIKITLGEQKATVNEKEVDISMPAQMISGTTYVPLRFVSEILGSTVEWNGANKLLTINNASE